MIYEISDCTLCNKQVLFTLEDELSQAKINMTKLSKIIDNQGDQIEMLKKELKYIVLNHLVTLMISSFLKNQQNNQLILKV